MPHNPALVQAFRSHGNEDGESAEESTCCLTLHYRTVRTFTISTQDNPGTVSNWFPPYSFLFLKQPAVSDSIAPSPLCVWQILSLSTGVAPAFKLAVHPNGDTILATFEKECKSV